MSYLTRDLFSYSVARGAGELVTLIIKQQAPNGDGSFSVTTTRQPIRARFVDLTPSQIKRMQDRGITLNSGINCSVVGELPKAPDQIVTSQGIIYKVHEFTINENISVMICDLPSMRKAT